MARIKQDPRMRPVSRKDRLQLDPISVAALILRNRQEHLFRELERKRPSRERLAELCLVTYLLNEHQCEALDAYRRMKGLNNSIRDSDFFAAWNRIARFLQR